MEPITPINLSGYLLEYSAATISKEMILRFRAVSFIREIAEARRWDLFDFECPEALMGEDEHGIQGPFHYPLVCRISGNRLLLLSRARPIVDFVLSHGFAPIFRPNLRPVPVAVHELVTKIAHKPEKYVLSFVHVRVSGFGNAIRAASFYGEDIGEAEFFRKNLHLFSCFTCGLRDVAAGADLLRLNTEGFLSFHCPMPSRLLEVQAVLSYIRELGFL